MRLQHQESHSVINEMDIIFIVHGITSSGWPIHYAHIVQNIGRMTDLLYIMCFGILFDSVFIFVFDYCVHAPVFADVNSVFVILFRH